VQQIPQFKGFLGPGDLDVVGPRQSKCSAIFIQREIVPVENRPDLVVGLARFLALSWRSIAYSTRLSVFSFRIFRILLGRSRLSWFAIPIRGIREIRG
jgi:hypothetical protein